MFQLVASPVTRQWW